MKEEQLQYCINVCWSCRDTSQKALYNHYIKLGEKNVDAAHVKIMTDCIQICQNAADFLTRYSRFDDQICALCALICDACAISCDRFETEEMQRCAEMCRKCATYCRGENI